MSSRLLIPKPNLISCLSPSFPPLRNPKPHHHLLKPQPVRLHLRLPLLVMAQRRDPMVEEEREGSVETKVAVGGGVGDWATSVLLFGFYAAVMYYVFQLSPNQTPSTDLYFLQKLLNLKGDDGFRMNEVLVALWYIMGLWPVVYSMLLVPSGRSSKGNVPVWPFLVISFFAGAYGLIPYFILWRPPPPPVEEEKIRAWPLNFLESKITSALVFASGLGLIVYAGFAGGNTWKEFYQYIRESRLVHATSLDFLLLSAFSAFWVYNDMTARRWYDKGSWLLPLALVPFLGPALYLLLRPSLSALPSVASSNSKEE